MPIYTVKGPDGKTYDVKGPEGATAAQLGAFITSQQPQRPDPTAQALRAQAQMNPVERFAMGVARPVFETGYGIKQLAGGQLTPEQEHRLAVLRGNKGMAGTTGRIAGEMATFALPGGAGTKLATKAPQAVARLAPLAADIGVSAGMEALKAPEEGRTRGQAAMEGAGGAAFGRAVAAPLGALATGVRNVTDDAAAFMREHTNVIPTLGQMKGGMVRAAEERLKAVPFVGEQIKKREREAIEQWNRNLSERALPSASAPNGPMPRPRLPEGVRTGQESIAHVQDRFTDAYDSIFKDRKFELGGDGSVAARFDDLADNLALPKDASERAQSRLKDMAEMMETTSTSGEAASRIDDNLREFARSARQNGFSDEADIYDFARKIFRGGLPKDVNARLREIDAAYRDWVPVERAAAYKNAGATEGVFSPSQLLGASRASSDTVRKRGFAAGKAPQQQEAQRAGRVLSNDITDLGKGPGTAEKILGVGAFLNPAVAAPFIPTLVPYSKAGAKALAGKYPWQGKLRTLSDILAEQGVTAGRTGAAIEE